MASSQPRPLGVEGPMQALHRKLTVAEQQAEEQRKATLHEKNAEVQRLAKADEERRDVCDQELSARKRILDEMRSVKDHVHAKLLSAQVKGRLAQGVADRALDRAGHRMQRAKEASIAWQDRADEVERESQHVAAKCEEVLASARGIHAGRIATTQRHCQERVELGERLVEEAANNFDQQFQRHHENCVSQERHHMQVATLKHESAERTRKEAANQVHYAVEKSRREQERSVHEIQLAREAAMQKVAEAQRALAEQRRICQAAIQQENVCSAQARRIASSKREQANVDSQLERQLLEADLARVKSHAERTIASTEEENPKIEALVDKWELRSKRILDSARAYASEEQTKAEERVKAAKAQLANLQARCAAQIRELQDRWEEAKKVDEEKVRAAEARVVELTQYCEATLQKCERHCEEMLERTERHAEAKKVQMEEKVATIDHLSKQRVAMAASQSRERRKQAEQRLEALKRHIEDVKKRCGERVKIENETCEQKVELARVRYREYAERAEQRSAEAEQNRDAARAAYAAVMARCKGAAAEARRRGLTDIAEELEPKPSAIAELGAVLGRSPEALMEEEAKKEPLEEEVAPLKKMKEDPMSMTGSTVSPTVFSPTLEGLSKPSTAAIDDSKPSTAAIDDSKPNSA